MSSPRSAALEEELSLDQEGVDHAPFDLARIRERLGAHQPARLVARARALESTPRSSSGASVSEPSAEGRRDEAVRAAVVAAVLRAGERGPEVLLIRRAEREGDPWSGHMAFPGGRREPRDPDLLTTARRETCEEVGLALAGPHAELLGQIDDLEAVAHGRRTGLVIRPFVFLVEGEVSLRPDAREVAEALWIPIGPLARGERDTRIPYRYEGRAISLPAYDHEGRVVWGLTYRMLRSLFAVIASRR